MGIINFKSSILLKLKKVDSSLIGKDASDIYSWKEIKVALDKQIKQSKKWNLPLLLLSSLMTITIFYISIAQYIRGAGGPDLNEYSVFIFVSVLTIISTFFQLLRTERLKALITLIETVEEMEKSNTPSS